MSFYVIGQNSKGVSVRVDIKPKPITDAALRFLAFIRTVETDSTPHRLWTGGPRFRIDDDLVTTPARAALILAGEVLTPGVRVKEICGVAGCVALSHLEAER
jgi:hypothetical protein